MHSLRMKVPGITVQHGCPGAVDTQHNVRGHLGELAIRSDPGVDRICPPVIIVVPAHLQTEAGEPPEKQLHTGGCCQTDLRVPEQGTHQVGPGFFRQSALYKFWCGKSNMQPQLRV